AVLVANLPIPGGGDSMPQRAIVQHRQIETRPIPRDQLRTIAFDAVEESPYDLPLVELFRRETEYVQAVAATHDHGDHEHLVLWQRQEIRLACLLLLEGHNASDVVRVEPL